MKKLVFAAVAAFVMVSVSNAFVGTANAETPATVNNTVQNDTVTTPADSVTAPADSVTAPADSVATPANTTTAQ